MRPVNLIPRERARRQAARRHRRGWVRFLRAYGVGLVVVSGMVMLPAHAGPRPQEGALARLEAQIKKNDEAIQVRKKELAELGRELEVARFVGEQPDWSLVMEAVSRSRSETGWWFVRGCPVRVTTTDVALESFEMATEKQEIKGGKASGASGSQTASRGPGKSGPEREVHVVRIAGVASSPIGALQFVRRLEKLEFAESVVVKDTRAHLIGEATATHFDIVISVPGDRIIVPAKDGGGK